MKIQNAQICKLKVALGSESDIGFQKWMGVVCEEALGSERYFDINKWMDV